jgi:hypothetical protein
MTNWTQQIKTRLDSLISNTGALASIDAKNSLIVKISGSSVGVNANQYAPGDLLGNKLTLINALRIAGGSGLLQSITVQDLSNQKGALDVVIFDSDPSGTTFTNNAAFDVADADIVKIIGVVSIIPSDYIGFADSSVATKSGLAIPVAVAAGRNLYACVVSRGTPTYTANELGIAFGFLQD